MPLIVYEQSQPVHDQSGKLPITMHRSRIVLSAVIVVFALAGCGESTYLNMATLQSAVMAKLNGTPGSWGHVGWLRCSKTGATAAECKYGENEDDLSEYEGTRAEKQSHLAETEGKSVEVNIAANGQSWEAPALRLQG